MQKFDYKKYFFKKDKKGKVVPKKITLMGLGGFPRSLIEAEFLAKLGVDLIITDLTPAENLKKELKKLAKYKNVKYTLGKHKISDFKNRDIVFSANGVPLGNKYIETAKKYSKVTTKTVAYLFYILQKESEEKSLDIKTIGVTGTKGKSTTTAMAFHLLKVYADSKKKKNNVFTCGNVRDTANLPILAKAKAGDYVVAEIDSWLAQGFGGLKISPNIAIFTNFFNDHQNYYHSMEKYYKDKSYIFKFQEKGDFTIFTNQSAVAYKKYFNKRIKSKKIIARTYKMPKWNYTVFGDHNLKNISQVLTLATSLNIPKNITKKAFETFEAEEGRFQELPSKKGIIFYNDNNATQPTASIMSLQSLRKKYPKKRIFLLAGGANKEYPKKDFQKLAKVYEKNAFFAVYFEGTGTDILLKSFSKQYLNDKKKNFMILCKMKEAFSEVVKRASGGDVIVLSPGMASFGCFKNEYDKNDQFLKEYQKWIKNKK